MRDCVCECGFAHCLARGVICAGQATLAKKFAGVEKANMELASELGPAKEAAAKARAAMHKVPVVYTDAPCIGTASTCLLG